MPRFKLTVAYDGGSFVGWQRQAEGTSVQGLLEDALSALDLAPVTVEGAGRTDAGVHALGQVASVSLTRSIDCRTLVRAVNARLPDTVRLLAAEDVVDDFHARFTARRKLYRYQIWNGPILSPFRRGFVWHVPAPLLDAGAMSAAAAVVVGRHDFAAFQGAGTPTTSTAREIISSRLSATVSDPHGERVGRAVLPEGAVDVDEAVGVLLTYEVCGDGFLRHMVRNLVGTLVEVGRRKYSVETMGEILASRSRASAGPTAPAAGLFLVRIDYPDGDAGDRS